MGLEPNFFGPYFGRQCGEGRPHGVRRCLALALPAAPVTSISFGTSGQWKPSVDSVFPTTE